MFSNVSRTQKLRSHSPRGIKLFGVTESLLHIKYEALSWSGFATQQQLRKTTISHQKINSSQLHTFIIVTTVTQIFHAHNSRLFKTRSSSQDTLNILTLSWLMRLFSSGLESPADEQARMQSD
ncbi:hypothetical protein HELRODRAFT_180018 [Helobdella robusta]|uniref:Uncharacterized protein n=1 Tax=Helobdella robusta TaxID=6412 RepID=T1FFC7_HELRO|nr:hypothetical protein HELRODRAFT_180018 [Helobdella robusta]ESN94911.1 hypothetical protein HELRODRAFT_180018 [Helobdella robusta]